MDQPASGALGSGRGDVGDAQHAASRGTLALVLATVSLVLTLIFMIGCPGLSCLSFGLAGASVFMAYAGMSQARDTTTHIAAIALGGLSAVLSLMISLVFALVFALYGGMLSVALMSGT